MSEFEEKLLETLKETNKTLKDLGNSLASVADGVYMVKDRLGMTYAEDDWLKRSTEALEAIADHLLVATTGYDDDLDDDQPIYPQPVA